MKIRIKGAGTIEDINIYDEKTRVNWISDMLGNAGAFNDGTFTYDKTEEIYETDAGTYDFWAEYIDDYNHDSACIDYLISALYDAYERDEAVTIESFLWLDLASNSEDYTAHHCTKQKVIEDYWNFYLNDCLDD